MLMRTLPYLLTYLLLLANSAPVQCCKPTLLCGSRRNTSWSREGGTVIGENRRSRCRRPLSPVRDRSYRGTVAVARRTVALSTRPDPGRSLRTPSVPTHRTRRRALYVHDNKV